MSPLASTLATTIAGVAGELPPYSYPQAEITAQLAEVLLGGLDGTPVGLERWELLHRLHAATGVDRRHLVLPLERYRDLSGFGAANDVFLGEGARLAQRAVGSALDAAGLTAAEVDLVMSVSTTGLGVPSLEARLHAPLGLRPDVKRVPVFGLGCVAGAAGIARLHDYLAGHPDDVAVLLSVELCSLTFQADDTSTANLVSSGLFGDGAAAVVLVGARRAQALGLAGRPRVVAARSRFYPDTERVMGWDIGDSGFRIVLAATVADVVEKYLRDDVDAFLAGQGLRLPDIGTWVAHPGGPKVIDALLRTLELAPDALRVTRQQLARRGNLSSSSVLHVLAETIAGPAPEPGSHGLLLAMGPGFCSELVLLEW
ncbi:MAG TPA: 3-oxoacyl-[acyl-carrier-protein] synthase III C-terminal domain-containing protein [Kineosporiaceae bacterium]|nr:3-oxoacyl-[acyl-carrier-protein] synthase III C-terminal domain-containing protein [Kineosporiaceae bacterium]